MSSILIRDIGELFTLQAVAARQGRRIKEADLAPAKKQALLVEKGRVAWLGSQAKIPKKLISKRTKEVSVGGRSVLPGFIEAHTHLIFGGHRAAEFEARNQGISYQEIASKGGGILSTMKGTRALSPAKIQQESQAKVDRFVDQGVTTLEVKSGYALNLKDELKCLQVAGQLKGPRIVPTFLGAHARPPEFESNESYLQFLSEKVLPEVKRKKLSNRVDLFWEKGFFEGPSAIQYLNSAREMGFQLTLHADQLSACGASEYGVLHGAQSLDHLIHLPERLIPELAKTNTVAMLLPAADVYLKCPFPKARNLIDAGVIVGLSTDYNPGSSPTQDLQWVGLLARLEMKMSFAETLSALTVGPAWALGLEKETGSLQTGLSADLQVLDGEISELFLSPGRTFTWKSMSQGRWL